MGQNKRTVKRSVNSQDLISNSHYFELREIKALQEIEDNQNVSM